MLFQSIDKANLYKLKKITFSKTAVFLFKILKKKKCKKTGPQRVPPCRLLHLQLYIGTSICNKKQPFGLTCIFCLLSSFFNCGWMVLNCDWMLFQSIDKANLYKLKKNTVSKTAVFNQNPMEIPSEPIRKERICQNFFRSLGGWSRFLIYYCESDPPLKKKKK